MSISSECDRALARAAIILKGGENQIELLNIMKESITFQPLNVGLMQQS